jgi:membrane-associated phospholipid phosphatase
LFRKMPGTWPIGEVSIGMVVATVLSVLSAVATTTNTALWAFCPDSYRMGPRLRRVTGILTVGWAVFLVVAGALLLVLGGWQSDVLGAVALACWLVTLLAVRKRRLTSRAA